MGVRARLDGDLVRCVRVLADVHRVDGYPTYWPEDPAGWLSPTGLFGSWVADFESRVVGHIALSSVGHGRAAEVWSDATGCPRARLAGISRLFVSQDARRAGVGAALLDTACAEAARRGLHPVLDVVETNRDAIRFYEHLGWRRVYSGPWADARDELLTVHYFIRARRSGDTAPPGRPPRTRAG
jgi:GNAT superfamily N-acetyltransferase